MKYSFEFIIRIRKEIQILQTVTMNIMSVTKKRKTLQKSGAQPQTGEGPGPTGPSVEPRPAKTRGQLLFTALR